MRIEIIDKDGNEIQNLNLESNPFNVGQIIHLSVNNRNKEFWTAEEIQKSFIVDKIEHYVRVDYSFNKTVQENVSVSIEVSEADA
ncbi:MAG: hypothetical protein ACRC76_12405 [Proteocatella sp.]